MSPVENVRSGLSEIWGHKLRSALTLVGVILGVFSINCMFSIVAGVRGAISGVFETIGLDGVVFVFPRGMERDERTAWNLSSKGMSIADADSLRRDLAGVAYVSPLAGMQRWVEYDGKRSQVRMEAVNEDYLEMRNMKIDKGRALLPSDLDASLPVAVIGPEVAKDLFGVEDPLGKEIPIDGVRFRVIGVLKKNELPPGMGGGGGMFRGNTVHIPISTARLYMLGPRAIVGLIVKAREGTDFMEVATQAETLVARRHRGVRDFEVENVGEDILKEKDEVQEMLDNFNVVLGCIAGTALLVGGIGILSVMMIAVNERLYEIGLRKAVGATDAEILVQFLVEASTLSAVGAVFGTGLALVAVELLSPKFPWGLAVSAGGLSLAAFFAVAIGLGFGLYPAWLASRMDPVDALRAA